jgi:uncharacterized membrane protein YkvA (DUF1232 family)
MLQRFKAWAAKLEQEVIALWFAYRHPDTPWHAKLVAALVVGYAFSPIDLIPDFIPILGLLDDALLVPLGIWIAIKLIPQSVHADAHEQARAWIAGKHERPRNRIAASAIVTVWVVVLVLCTLWLWREIAG